MTISKNVQFLLLSAALLLLAVFSFSSGYPVGKDIAHKEKAALRHID